MLWRINPKSDEPLYAQLVAQVHIALSNEQLAPGDRLPPARELAESLDINVHTVLNAYQNLRDSGLIELRRGRGAVVAASVPHTQPKVRNALTRFAIAAREAGLSIDAATTLLKAEMSQ